MDFGQPGCVGVVDDRHRLTEFTGRGSWEVDTDPARSEMGGLADDVVVDDAGKADSDRPVPRDAIGELADRGHDLPRAAGQRGRCRKRFTHHFTVDHINRCGSHMRGTDLDAENDARHLNEPCRHGDTRQAGRVRSVWRPHAS